MEKGEGAQLQGKSLDSIEPNLDENLLETPSDDEEQEDDDEIDDIVVQYAPACSEDRVEQETNDQMMGVSSEEQLVVTESLSIPRIQKKKRILIPWTPVQKSKVLTFLKTILNMQSHPKDLSVKN